MKDRLCTSIEKRCDTSGSGDACINFSDHEESEHSMPNITEAGFAGRQNLACSTVPCNATSPTLPALAVRCSLEPERSHPQIQNFREERPTDRVLHVKHETSQTSVIGGSLPLGPTFRYVFAHKRFCLQTPQYTL